MAKARKLKSGNWNVQVYSHTDSSGKRHYASFTASTKAEANRQAAEFMANKGREDKPQDITVGQAVKNYIESKSNVLSPKTYKEYKACIKHYDSIANIKIGSLTSVDLQEYVNEISKKNSPKTVRNKYSLLSSAISLYTDRHFKVTLPQKKVVERHIPTDKDMQNLIENANPRLKLAIILGSMTCRRGEICALRYGDILRDFNSIYIHSDMIDTESGWIVKEIPKNSSSVRRIRLPKEVIEMMGEGKDDDFILGIKPSTITTDFIHLRNRLKLKCRFHDTRHYAASILHAIGVPDTYIMERGGWSSDVVLKSVYRNSLSDKSSQFTEIANNYFSENILKKLKE